MEYEEVVHPFAPIYNSESKVLILGSFPSIISRKNAFYYGNPANRFWKVMEVLFEEEIKDKKQFCLDHHIALWDVIDSCSIQGSSDASIQNVIVNDIEGLIRKSSIKKIFTTGRKATDLFEKHVRCSLPCTYLPSTSGANASMHLEDLADAYRILLEYL